MDIFEVGIGLGSNMGDKAANIHEAMRRLCGDARVKLVAMSRLYRTAPWGPVAQDFFANACALVRTAIAPLELLDRAKEIEVEMGREQSLRWGPRLIDIDLLYYGDIEMNTSILVLPHRDLLNRPFVLIPLAEIAPEKRIHGRLVRTAAQASTADVELWQAE